MSPLSPSSLPMPPLSPSSSGDSLSLESSFSSDSSMDQSFALDTATLIVDPSELYKNLTSPEYGLKLTPEKIQSICDIIQNQFGEFQKDSSASTFGNVKIPHLPKMHFFFNPSEKIMTLYLKIPNKTSIQGGLKKFHEAVRVVFFPGNSPIFEKAARLRNHCALTELLQERVNNEVEHLLKLQNNPGVCPLYDFGSYYGANSQLEVVFYEKLYNCTLNDVKIILHKPTTPLTTRQTLLKLYFELVLRASTSMHADDCVHRDIQPANILCKKNRNEYEVVFSDVELASTEKELSHLLTGLPNYYAPEHLNRNLHFGIGIDYWALGICLYELYYGVFPYGNGILGSLCILKETLSKLTKPSSAQLSTHVFSLGNDFIGEANQLIELMKALGPVLMPDYPQKERDDKLQLLHNKFHKFTYEIKKHLNDLQALKNINPDLFNTLATKLNFLCAFFEDSFIKSWDVSNKTYAPCDGSLPSIIFGLLQPNPLVRLSDKDALLALLKIAPRQETLSLSVSQSSSNPKRKREEEAPSAFDFEKDIKKSFPALTDSATQPQKKQKEEESSIVKEMQLSSDSTLVSSIVSSESPLVPLSLKDLTTRSS